jgi:hypothetical protein
MSPAGERTVWRFGDQPRDAVDLSAARRLKI